MLITVVNAVPVTDVCSSAKTCSNTKDTMLSMQCDDHFCNGNKVQDVVHVKNTVTAALHILV